MGATPGSRHVLPGAQVLPPIDKALERSEPAARMPMERVAVADRVPPGEGRQVVEAPTVRVRWLGQTLVEPKQQGLLPAVSLTPRNAAAVEDRARV